jgi:outer membrane biosynthesis protein TonB
MKPPQRHRLVLLAWLCAALPAGWARAAPPPAPPAQQVSAEAIELVGREAEQAHLLADARRRLQRAQRDLARAKAVEQQQKLRQTALSLEQRIRQIEARQRGMLTARQARELPVGALKSYIARVRQRIEVQGDRYPPQENGQSVTGATELVFIIRADGTLAHVQVLSSAPAGLGMQTAALLRQMEPFERFPPGVAAKVDRISFVRAFRFEPGGEPRYQLRVRPPAGRAGAQRIYEPP